MDALVAQKRTFVERFKSRQHLRLHMSLLLLGTAFSGLLATRLLLALGLKNLLVRYPLAVVIAYLIFFLGVKLWLKYVVALPAVRQTGSSGPVDVVADLPVSGSSSGSVPSGGGWFRGGRGNFGGGGASGSFEAQAAVADSGLGAASGAIDPGGGVVDAAGSAADGAASGLDLDEGWLVVLVLGAIAAVFLGVGIYLIYEAPLILSEAAFQAILAGSLVRGTRRIQSGDWLGSVFRATWVPLVVTLLLSLLAGTYILHVHPGVTRISELFAAGSK